MFDDGIQWLEQFFGTLPMTNAVKNTERIYCQSTKPIRNSLFVDDSDIFRMYAIKRKRLILGCSRREMVVGVVGFAL